MDVNAAYLDLLKRTLTRYDMAQIERRPVRGGGWRRRPVQAVQQTLRRAGLEIVRRHQVDLNERGGGRDWPLDGETMVGLRRLDNLQECIEAVIDDGIPGDIIETGVWRGGASIFAKAVLAVHQDQRRVWLADSFAGLPAPSLPQDEGLDLWKHPELAVSAEDVRANFARYGLLDDRVVFLEGWFKDTLPTIEQAQRFSVIRLDGDLYESTIQSLEHLYPLLSSGGFVIVDDYWVIDNCRQAVSDFRATHGVDEPIEQIDLSGVFWRRGMPTQQRQCR